MRAEHLPWGRFERVGVGRDERARGARRARREDAAGRMRATCRPIRVEVWELADGVKEDILRDWRSPPVAAYKGVHGLDVPSGEGLSI